MTKTKLITTAVILFIFAAAALVPAQDETVLRQRIRFERGRTTSVVKNTVRRGTNHHYILRAGSGQTMTVHLATGRDTAFTIYTPTDRIADADGVKDWSGELPENGDYTIEVATDRTASYTLEVTIR